MTQAFHTQQKVLFKHCDPAGIVFFPRCFEMINDFIEMFFDDALDVPFETLHPANGVPTAAIETQFLAPSRHGDILDFMLAASTLGRTSWRYTIVATCSEELRFETKATLVHIDASGNPTPWTDSLRQKLKDYEAPNDT